MNKKVSKMAKGNNQRGNKEVKKPKKVKEKISGTADSNARKSTMGKKKA